MLCEAAAEVWAAVAVEEGWEAFVTEVVAVTDEPVAAEVALVAAVVLIVAPPWGATTAESRYWERPSWTVIVTRRAEIVVPNTVALPPIPATAARVVALVNHCWPCWAYWPVPARKSATCACWMSVYWPAAAITSPLAPLAFGWEKLKIETSFTNLQ